MTNGDDDGLPITDPSDLDADVLSRVYNELHDAEPTTIDDWKGYDVENSPVAWMAPSRVTDDSGVAAYRQSSIRRLGRAFRYGR
jgi:hypothetical protein